MNGTLLDGALVPQFEPVPLAAGQELTLGRVVLEVTRSEAPEVLEPPAQSDQTVCQPGLLRPDSVRLGWCGAASYRCGDRAAPPGRGRSRSRAPCAAGPARHRAFSARRRRRMVASTVRSSTSWSRPHTRSSSWLRENTRPGALQQLAQQAELGRAEVHLAAAARHPIARQVHAQSAKRKTSEANAGRTRRNTARTRAISSSSENGLVM